MTSVREMIRAEQHALRQGNLTPSLLCDMLERLTSLIGNVNDELRTAEIDYKRRLLEHRQTRESSAEARMYAEADPMYARYREAKDTKELAIEMIHSVKAVLKSTADEMRLAR
jgi:hypothetical protein